MEEPRRLLGGDGTDLERSLLSAAQDEKPTSRGMQRAAVALAAATGASTFTKTVWAAREFFQPLTTKIVAGTVIAGSTAYVATQQLEGPPAAEPAVAAVIDERSRRAHPEEEAPPSEKPEEAAPDESAAIALEAPEEIPQKTLGSASTKQAKARCNISEEVKALDSARQSLDQGNASGALNKLSAYNAEFAGGCLGQEALVMRIRALVQSGRQSQAQALAKNFRARNPKSPYNKRIESIVAPEGER